MSKDCVDGLSATHREVVRSALIAAFGSAPISTITPIAGGASTASTFRVDAAERRYLLRVEGQPSPLRNPYQYISMRIAAEAGIAPKIHYIDEAAGVAVIDFIEQQSLKTYPGGARTLAQALGELLLRRPRGPLPTPISRLRLCRRSSWRSAKGGSSPAPRKPNISWERCSLTHSSPALLPRDSMPPFSQVDAVTGWLICLRFA
jgi:hypothetical protein